MPRFLDRTNMRYRRLLIIKHAGKDKRNKHLWLCQCDCGNKKVVVGDNLSTLSIPLHFNIWSESLLLFLLSFNLSSISFEYSSPQYLQEPLERRVKVSKSNTSPNPIFLFRLFKWLYCTFSKAISLSSYNPH